MQQLLLIAALFISVAAMAQKSSIEAIITDKNQTPLQGIIIQFIQCSYFSRSVFMGIQRNFLLTIAYSFKK